MCCAGLIFIPLLASASGAQRDSAQPSAAAACPTVEVGVVAERPADAAHTLTTSSGQKVVITANPLLTVNDFTDANVTLTEGQIVLNVRMTPDAAKRVQAFSASHVGQRMAFVVNGRVINTPKILDPITGSGFLLAPFQRQEADGLAALINGREPSCRSAVK